jgi:hypothetical protein
MRLETRLLPITLFVAVAITPAAGETIHPCDAFTLADVSSTFEVSGEAVTAERGKAPGNVTCSYKWKKADWQAIEERNRAAMMKALTSGRGTSGLSPERSEAELFITFHGTTFKSSAEAVQAFDAMVERLTRGVSSGAGEAKFEMKATFDPSQGLGEKAAWSNELRQVSVVSGTRLYHVRVRMADDAQADRAPAEAVARKIATSLR